MLATAACFIFAKLSKLNYHDGTLSTEQQGLFNTEQVAFEEITSEGEASTEEVLISSEEAGALAETEVILAEGDVYSDDDIFNILLLGTDERSADFGTNARADSIMILSLNKKANTMKLVSLQRGMGFPILEGIYKGQYDWITHLFRYGGRGVVKCCMSFCMGVSDKAPKKLRKVW